MCTFETAFTLGFPTAAQYSSTESTIHGVKKPLDQVSFLPALLGTYSDAGKWRKFSVMNRQSQIKNINYYVLLMLLCTFYNKKYQ